MVVDIIASIGGLIVDLIKATQYIVETTPNVVLLHHNYLKVVEINNCR